MQRCLRCFPQINVTAYQISDILVIVASAMREIDTSFVARDVTLVTLVSDVIEVTQSTRVYFGALLAGEIQSSLLMIEDLFYCGERHEEQRAVS